MAVTTRQQVAQPQIEWNVRTIAQTLTDLAAIATRGP